MLRQLFQAERRVVRLLSSSKSSASSRTRVPREEEGQSNREKKESMSSVADVLSARKEEIDLRNWVSFGCELLRRVEARSTTA